MGSRARAWTPVRKTRPWSRRYLSSSDTFACMLPSSSYPHQSASAVFPEIAIVRAATPPARPATFASVFHQDPLAVLDGEQDAAEIVDAGMVLRGHGDDALGRGQGLGSLQRVAQRRAERLRARFAFFEGFRDGVLQQQTCVINAGGENRRLGAVQALVTGVQFERQFFRRHAVGNLLGNEQQR